MSKHEPEMTLHQILAYAREAFTITQGRTRADLDHPPVESSSDPSG